MLRISGPRSGARDLRLGTAVTVPLMFIDARGPRFGAAVTSVVLALAISLGVGPAATVLLGLQTLVFGLGAVVGLHAQPYGLVYARVVRPRLTGEVPLEDARPPRFAQVVGLGCSSLAFAGALTGVAPLFTTFATLALVAAFLNAAFGFCLGCEIFLLAKRVGLPHESDR